MTPPRMLPTPRQPSMEYTCTTCRRNEAKRISYSPSNFNYDFSKLESFFINVNSLLIDLDNKIQLIGEKICIIQESLDRINCKITELEGSICDHSCMINELERSVALFTNTVKTNLITNHEPASNGVRACTNNAPESSAPLYSDVVKSVHESVSPSPRPLVGRRPRPEPDSRSLPDVAVTHNMHKPNTVLIMGDSNTRHVHLGGAGVSQVRIPTYVVDDIDPQKCIGYETVWLHVGVNSLKPRKCRNLTDVREKYNVLASKIDEITKVSPRTKVMVSPILPTALRALNHRIVYFNRLLLSNRERWHILNFGDFLDVDNGLLDRNFRSFKNEFDKIHLGYRGISLLTSLVRSGITKAIEGTSSCAPVQSASKLRDYY